MLLGTKLLPGVAADTSPSWRFKKIFLPSLFFHCSGQNVTILPPPLPLPLWENFPPKIDFVLCVYLRRCSSIESYTLHKEQTNSFFNAPRTDFRKRTSRLAGASAIATMKCGRFDGMETCSSEMFSTFWKHRPGEEITFISTSTTSTCSDAIQLHVVCE